jgi:DNA repair protein RadC
MEVPTTHTQLMFPNTPKYDPPKLNFLPVCEQPAFRVTHFAQACNLTELLAVLIGGQKQIELAQTLMAEFGGDVRRLYQAHPSELSHVKGVSVTVAVRIAAAFNLGLRLNNPPPESTTITSPADAAALVQYEMGLLEKEHLRIILLDRRNRVIDIVEIYKGSVNSSQVRVAEVFKPAIQRMASAIILIHNHPSGDPTPSPEDVALTRAIVQSGKLLDIDIMDHLIIGANRWSSLKERGLGFA